MFEPKFNRRIRDQVTDKRTATDVGLTLPQEAKSYEEIRDKLVNFVNNAAFGHAGQTPVGIHVGMLRFRERTSISQQP